MTSPVTYGVDQGAPDGDKTALTIKVESTLYTYVGDEAEAILSLIAREREAADRAERINQINRMTANAEDELAHEKEYDNNSSNIKYYETVIDFLSKRYELAALSSTKGEDKT